jgi:hypothetical protein
VKAKTHVDIEPKAIPRGGKVYCIVVEISIISTVPEWTNLGKEPTSRCTSVKDEWTRVMKIIVEHEKNHRDDLKKQEFLKNAHTAYLNQPVSKINTIQDDQLNKAENSQKILHKKIGHDVAVDINKKCK